MDRDQVAESLELFLAERGRPLLRAAVLLTGSQQDGEDLLQAALERLLKHWRTVHGDPGRYLQRTLYNLAADGWRRERTWRRKVHLLYPFSAGTADDSMAGVDLRDALVRLLLELAGWPRPDGLAKQAASWRRLQAGPRLLWAAPCGQTA